MAHLYGCGVQWKKELSVYTDGGWISGLLTHRHSTAVIIVVLVSSIISTNIYASSSDTPVDATGQISPISYFVDSFADDMLIEVVDDDTQPVEEIDNLDGLTLTYDDYVAAESQRETNDLLEASPAEDYSPLAAVSAIEAGVAVGERRPMTRTTVTEYEVLSGDTLETIARSFGLTTTTVMVANGINSRGLIRPGQKLKIMPVDGLLYVTKKGDTVTKIAKNYFSDAAEIAEFNRLPDWGALAIGTELILPGGRLPAAPAPVRTTSKSNTYIPPPSPNRNVAVGKLLWPAGCTRISQYYGRRHTGLDVACPMRTPLYAADDGIVVFSGWNRGGYGNMTIVDHGGGIFTRYAHATQNLKSPGDPVKRGDVIALMGSTGRSTGSHLHFEVMIGSLSRRVNPLDYLR